MKRYFKKLNLFMLTLVVTVFACTDLSENPYDMLTDADLGANPPPEIIEALTAPIYTRLTDVMFGWHGYFDLQEECADAVVTPARPNGWVDGGTYRTMHMHIWNSFQSHPEQLWNRVFGSINLINTRIRESMGIQGLESSLAELRAMRALYYYFLLDNFWNVPIVTEDDLINNITTPDQKTRKQVFEFIEKELKEAMPNLSETKVYGKMNKWTAKMILAKIYLNAKVYINEEKYNDAIAEVQDIIDSNLYTLESNYNANFTLQNENSKEQIFSIVFDATKIGFFHLPWKTLHPSSAATYNLSLQPWGGNCAIPQFIDTYDTEDLRYNIWIKGPQFASNGAPLYNSMDATLKNVQLNYTKEVGSIDGTKEYEGYRIGKYEIEKGVTGYCTSTDIPLFRYADALMIKAECLLRLGQADAAATIVTEVRTRAFPDDLAKAKVTGAQLQMGSSYNYGKYQQGVMLTTEGGADIQFGRFLDELGWEFAAEFRRRQDLIRFGVFTTKSWFSHSPNGSHRTIFDIPQSALNANPKLSHNPGY